MKKKTILSLFACCCAAFTACDMDLTSETSIATNESVQSVLDCQKYSNLFHAEWRSYLQNAYAMDALVQSGLITATADYGNTYGAFYRWEFTITDGAFSGCWSNNYNYIANANVLLKGAQALLDANTLSDADRVSVRLYIMLIFRVHLPISSWRVISVRIMMRLRRPMIMACLWFTNTILRLTMPAIRNGVLWLKHMHK